MEHCTNFQGS